MSNSANVVALPGLESICKELLQEEGYDASSLVSGPFHCLLGKARIGQVFLIVMDLKSLEINNIAISLIHRKVITFIR